MEVVIQPAVAEDAASVAALVGDLLGEIMSRTGVGHFVFDREAAQRHFREFLASGAYAAYLARLDGFPVAVATLAESRALYAGGRLGTLTELYVRPDLRSQGLGERLLETAQEHASRAGWVRLEVTTPPLPEFDAALRFYQGHGYEFAGGRKLKRGVT